MNVFLAVWLVAISKYGSTCKISVLSGKFDTEANTGTATATTSGASR